MTPACPCSHRGNARAPCPCPQACQLPDGAAARGQHDGAMPWALAALASVAAFLTILACNA